MTDAFPGLMPASQAAAVLAQTVDRSKYAVDPKTGLRPAMPNLTIAQRKERIDNAMALRLPDFIDIPESIRGKNAIIAGGGFSITRTLPDIRKRMRLSKQTNLIALNKTNDWLRSKGLIPTIGVLADPRPWIADYMQPHKDQIYLFSSKLDPVIFDRFLSAGAKVYLWHPTETADGFDERAYMLAKYPGRSLTLGTGFSTVGLRTVEIISLKAPKVELHGFDGSYDRDADVLYPYAKPNSFCGNDAIDRNDNTIKCGGYSFRFISNTMMKRQVTEWVDMVMKFCDDVAKGKRQDFKLTVAGMGAIPWMAWKSGQHADPAMMAKLHGTAKDIDWRPLSSREVSRGSGLGLSFEPISLTDVFRDTPSV